MNEQPGTIDGIQRSDPGILEQVVRGCLPGLLRAARFSGLPPDRAEDAVQASLLVFVQRAAAFDGRARACTWIHGILARKIWEERRGAQRDTRQEEIDEVIESRFDSTGSWSRPPQGPLQALARGECRRELEACLSRLSDRQRMAFTLREVEGFSTEEVCKVMEVSANNLGVLLFRARNGLRECLESKGFEGSGDASMQ